MHYLFYAHVVFHLIDVGVPHLGEEPEGRRGIWVIYRELDSSLSDKIRHVRIYMMLRLMFITLNRNV